MTDSTGLTAHFDSRRAVRNANFGAPQLTPPQLYLMSLNSAESRRTITSQLKQIAKLTNFEDFNQIPWGDFSRELVLAIIHKLKKSGLAPTTVRGYLTTLKSVCREAWIKKLLDTDTYTLIKDIKAPKGSRLVRGRALTLNEVQTLISSCQQDNSNRGLRDAAIFAILVGCGLRRAELVSLKIEHLVLRTRSLMVVGKGDKQRLCRIPDFAWPILERYLRDVRGEHVGPIFTRARAGDEITDKALTPDGLRKVLEYRQLESGWIEPFSPHDLRRTFASRLLEMEVDLNTVKRMMGHSSIETTAKYDHRDERFAEEAGAKLKY